MRNKFLHLHDKIKAARETLGYSQKDFIVEVSKQMQKDGTRPDTEPLTPGLASQWEKRRTTPRPEHIAAIAKLTRSPELYMLWFLQDLAPANRAVRLHPNGVYDFLPEFDEQKGRENPPGPIATHLAFFSPLTSWVHNVEDVQKIRNRLMSEWPPEMRETYEAQIQQLEAKVQKETEPTATTPEPRRSYESEKADEHIQAAATSDTDVNTEPHVVKVVANTQADTGSTTTSPTGTPINKLAEMARTLRISDVVAFPPKGALEQIREQHLTEKEFRNERRAREDKFFEALKLLLENNLGEPDLDSAVRRPITSGIFRTRADVYFRNVSVEICFLDPTMPLRFFGFELMESMEHLLMVDRMQGKHFRKTVLFCTHEARAEMPKLIEHTRNYVDSARGLEINVAFATGPADAARQIADLITKTNADKV